MNKEQCCQKHPDFNGNGEPLRGSYAVLTFGADNRLADDRRW